MTQAEMIRKNLNFCIEYTVGVVTYCLKGKNTGDTWEQAIVIFNGNREEVIISVPAGRFRIIASGDLIDEEGRETIEGGSVTVAPLCMMLLARWPEGPHGA